MRSSFREIAEFMDPVASTISLRELLDMHLLEEGQGYAEVWRRHNHPDEIIQKFFMFNTYLMDIPGKGRKPLVEHRDKEIGQYTAQHFDICCLSEVWLREERKDLVAEWPESAHMAHKGGRASLINALAMLGSAGLITLSKSLEITAENFYEFKNESGKDKRADKGCLLTVFNPIKNNPGRVASSLNIYSTHMNADGEAKNKQLFELVKFIWETQNKVAGDTSRPGRDGLNVNLVCGDFNIDKHQRGGLLQTEEVSQWSEVKNLPRHLQNAVRYQVEADGRVTETVIEAKSAFSLLRDLLLVLGYYDLWETRNGTTGYTSNLTTTRHSSNIPTRDPRFNFYCDDSVVPNTRVVHDRPTAIDHIFVSAPKPNTSFTIDYTRPRRPFTERPSDAKDFDEFRFMSDHLGISTDILMVPK